MIKHVILICFCLSTSVIYAQSNSIVDSLTFKHEKSDKEVLIINDMLLEILTKEKLRITGVFVGGSASTIEIKHNDKLKTFNIKDLKKIVVYKDVSKDPVTGTLRFIVSASSATSLLLGGGAAAGGIATLNNNKALGIGLIGVSIPLIYYGIKLHFMLKNADRDIIKPDKGWIVMN